ncbi:MAG TPA: ferredoxin family protein [Mariniphaga sp.]|nr:ferredoxin family protein [Mariniphaga sp.]
MAKVRGAIIVDTEACKGCEVCIEACPQDVLALNHSVNNKGYNYCYMNTPEDCTGCANCAIVCPDTVISVYRLRLS